MADPAVPPLGPIRGVLSLAISRVRGARAAVGCGRSANASLRVEGRTRRREPFVSSDEVGWGVRTVRTYACVAAAATPRAPSRTCAVRAWSPSPPPPTL